MQAQAPFASVTTAVDGEVLAVVARAPKAFTLREMSRLIPQRSYSGIRKAAERLAIQGVLVSRSVGVQLTYELNRHHLAADAVIALATLYDRFLERLEAECEGLGSTLIYAAVFGSAARREMRPDSDVDILFVQRGDTVDDQFEDAVHAICEHAHAWSGNDVRPAIFAEGGIDSADPLVANVIADSRTLYGDISVLRLT